MDMQRIMNNENYIRTGGIGENFFIPMMKNQDYRHKIENEISLRLGGKKNLRCHLKKGRQWNNERWKNVKIVGEKWLIHI